MSASLSSQDVVRRLPLEKEAQEKRVADTMAMLSREKERLLEPVGEGGRGLPGAHS
jgi:hypothetical protein